ncbi:MAG: ATP-binding protein [bacterium]
MSKTQKPIRIRHRLLTRLLLSHILIVAIPLFYTGRVLIDTAQDSIEKTILERNYEFVRRSTREIELSLNTAVDVIKNQARNQSIYEMNKSAQELAINTIITDFNYYNEISILDTRGNLLASTSFGEESFNRFSHNGIALNTILSGQSYLSDVYVSDVQLPIMDIYEPIKRHDEVVGILYAVVDLKFMWDLVGENAVGKDGQAFIINKEGLFVAHSNPKNVYLKRFFKNKEILRKIRRGQKGRTIYTNENKVEMVAAYAAFWDKGWGFMIQQPSYEAFAPARSMRLRVLQVMMGSVLLASLLAYFYTRWIVKPVNHLVSGMDRFSRGDMNYRIEKVGNDEIGTLSENFNEMADRLIEYQNTLKRTERLETLGKLASVLSHEIRNPLNSMVINIQILKREFSKECIDKRKVEKFHGILVSEIKRVDQLVSDFLLIARPPKLQRQKVAINKVLDEIVVVQVAEALKTGIRVEREYGKEPIYTNVDVAKIKQVFLNLIKNAIQAMSGGGKLVVKIDEVKAVKGLKRGLRGRFVAISFSDTGRGIPRQDLTRIFDFYYSTKKDGSGLGLAIVQQIVEEHQGEIVVESRVGKGTTFTIYLPQN